MMRLVEFSGAGSVIFPRLRGILFLAGVLFAGLAVRLPAGAASELELAEARRVEREYVRMQAHFQERPDNAVAAWQFGRACFRRGDFSTNDAQREALAELGRAACRASIRLNSNSAAAHYYFAANTGQLARTKLLRALGLLDDMEAAFFRAIAIDPKFEFAAPHRSLGRLYKDAPGWPTSIGSRRKAREHLESAHRLAPEFPANPLLLAEARLEWGERERVRKDLPALELVMTSARTNLTGEAWVAEWADWDGRLVRLKSAMGTAGTNPSTGKRW